MRDGEGFVRRTTSSSGGRRVASGRGCKPGGCICRAVSERESMWCTLHCTTLHCTALHCTALHCTALHCTTVSSVSYDGGVSAAHSLLSWVWRCKLESHFNKIGLINTWMTLKSRLCPNIVQYLPSLNYQLYAKSAKQKCLTYHSIPFLF
jgi:hypothetical protein